MITITMSHCEMTETIQTDHRVLVISVMLPGKSFVAKLAITSIHGQHHGLVVSFSLF